MKVVCADVYMCHSTSNSGYVTFCEKSVVNFFVMGEKISLQKYFDLKNIPLESFHWDLSKTESVYSSYFIILFVFVFNFFLIFFTLLDSTYCCFHLPFISPTTISSSSFWVVWLLRQRTDVKLKKKKKKKYDFSKWKKKKKKRIKRKLQNYVSCQHEKSCCIISNLSIDYTKWV